MKDRNGKSNGKSGITSGQQQKAQFVEVAAEVPPFSFFFPCKKKRWSISA
jgi:hypothetical protein